MPEYGSVKRHPLMSLFYLVVFIILGYALSSLLAVIVFFLMNGGALTSAEIGESKESLLLMQAIVSVGSFVAPPVALNLFEKRTGADYLKFSGKPSFRMIILTVILMFSIAPFIDWTLRMNQMMDLPAFMEGIEQWIREKERELAELTKHLLTMKSPLELVVNLIVVAVIPAIGEEFLFRGCFQTIITRITRNQHLGIWIAAAIFSAIHVQFLGFFPRMFLGALFGYIFVWSGSIWPAVLAHFLNNASAVVTAYVLQSQGKSLDSMENPATSFPMAAASLAFALLVCYVFFNLSKKRNEVLND